MPWSRWFPSRVPCRYAFRPFAASLFLAVAACATSAGAGSAADQSSLPRRGISAHRGASASHPENTLAAFREAIRLGVHQVELDVHLTRDGKLVVMHDATVDRTTDGTGRIADLALAEIRRLDAGRWKDPQFAGERVPTLEEALAVMPENIWLNLHLKGGGELGAAVAQQVVHDRRTHQAFLAAGRAAAEAARRICPEILICNMDRQNSYSDYVGETIARGDDFIQLLNRLASPEDRAKLEAAGVRVNYCCTNDPDTLESLYAAGVDFVLVDDAHAMTAAAERLGIARQRPRFRDADPAASQTAEKASEPPPGWPRFHGPGRTNLSPETGLLKRWPDGGPPLAWKYADCGQGWSGVSIAGGLIFTAGDFEDVEMLLALDMDGRLEWRAEAGAAWRRSSPGSRSTPAYDRGALYHLNSNGRLAAFEATTGNELWAVDLVDRFASQWGIWGLAENLIVEDGKVFCMPGGPKGRVVALDQRTGETVWANTAIEHSAAYCSPTVVTHRGIRQWISMTQRSVVSLDVQSGELLWTVPFAPRAPQNALTPVYHDGHVFVACGHSSGGSLLRIADDSRSAEVVWHRGDLDNCHSGSILLDGKLFGAACRNGGRHFYCVDFFSGDDLQLDRTLGKVALTSAEGMLYCLGHQGAVSLVEATPRGFEIVSRFDLPGRPVNTYLAHPVICDGRLYLRGQDTLYAFNIRAD